MWGSRKLKVRRQFLRRHIKKVIDNWASHLTEFLLAILNVRAKFGAKITLNLNSTVNYNISQVGTERKRHSKTFWNLRIYLLWPFVRRLNIYSRKTWVEAKKEDVSNKKWRNVNKTFQDDCAAKAKIKQKYTKEFQRMFSWKKTKWIKQ